MSTVEMGPGPLESGLETLGIAADPRLIALMGVYLDELDKWSRTYNLVSFRDRKELVVRHLLDSLSVQPWIGAEPLLDLGTGAGLPGIPLAIARPDLKVTLLDGNGKKLRFCRHVQRKLALHNVETVQARTEDFEPRPRFAQIISRAFASLADFAAAAQPALAPGGHLLAMKGRWPHDEITNLPGDVHVDAVEPLSVPHLHAERHLVMMSFSAPTATSRSSI
jgi:16S rRNA (guanine527-N7)-methyltransferase